MTVLSVTVFEGIKRGFEKVLQSSIYHLIRFGKGICSINFLLCPADTSLPQWLIPQLNEILLKYKEDSEMFLEAPRLIFRWQTSDRICVSHCSALFTLAICVWIHYRLFSVRGKVDRTSSYEISYDFIINGLLSDLLLLKF